MFPLFLFPFLTSSTDLPEQPILDLLTSLDLTNYTSNFTDPASNSTSLLLSIASTSHPDASLPIYRFLMDRGVLEAQFLYASLISPKNYTEAVLLWRSAADLGHSDSQLRYAFASYTGRGIPRNVSAALHYFRLSMQQGNLDAQVNYASMLQEGTGLLQNLTEAARLFQDAADRNSTLGQFHFGRALLWGTGVDQSYERAEHYLRQAMLKGHVGSKHMYGIMLSQGLGVKQDFARAASLFLEAARGGHGRAMVDYGYACLSGEGVPRNFTEAAQWFAEATRLGRDDAATLYANLLAAGAGVAQNLTAAARIFKIAADSGNEAAVIQYGIACWQGQGVARNLSEAAEYFGRLEGNPWGDYYVGQVLEEPGELQNYSEAVRLYEKAAEGGECEPAKAALGNLLVRGIGVERNLTRGMELLLAAKEKKSVDAMLYLGGIAEDGVLGKRDIVEAFGWYEEAANRSAVEEEQYPKVPDRRGVERIEKLVRDGRDEMEVVVRQVEKGERKRDNVVERLLAVAKRQDIAHEEEKEELGADGVEDL